MADLAGLPVGVEHMMYNPPVNLKNEDQGEDKSGLVFVSSTGFRIPVEIFNPDLWKKEAVPLALSPSYPMERAPRRSPFWHNRRHIQGPTNLARRRT